MRAAIVPALLVPVVLSFGAGCNTTSNFDFIEVHGSFADGTPISGHNIASTAQLPSPLLPALGTVIAVGAAFSGPEDLQGFRLEWQPNAAAAGGSFASDPNGPVVFYVVRTAPDGGLNGQEASVVNGGTITFTAVGSKITGTLSNLVLSRNGQTLVTVDNGSFQATKP